MRSQNSYARQPQLRRNSPNIDDNGEADDSARLSLSADNKATGNNGGARMVPRWSVNFFPKMRR
jgi:hypothetical protein